MHNIGSGPDDFRHDISYIVDDIRVIPRAACHRISAGPAIEHIRDAVAREHVIQDITGAVDHASTSQHQILEIRTEGPGHGALHRVGTRAGVFNDRIAGPNDIGVIPSATSQCVGSTVPGQHVVRCISSPINGTAAGQREVFEIGGQGIRERCLDPIRAFIRIFSHRIPGIIDDIGVIACAARHGIGPRAAA